MNYFDFIGVGVIGILGFFLKDLHSTFKEFKKNSEIQSILYSKEIGKLEGRIEMVQAQATNDAARIEQLSTLKLDQISKELTELTKYVHQKL